MKMRGAMFVACLCVLWITPSNPHIPRCFSHFMQKTFSSPAEATKWLERNCNNVPWITGRLLELDANDPPLHGIDEIPSARITELALDRPGLVTHLAIMLCQPKDGYHFSFWGLAPITLLLAAGTTLDAERQHVITLRRKDFCKRISKPRMDTRMLITYHHVDLDMKLTEQELTKAFNKRKQMHENPSVHVDSTPQDRMCGKDALELDRRSYVTGLVSVANGSAPVKAAWLEGEVAIALRRLSAWGGMMHLPTFLLSQFTKESMFFVRLKVREGRATGGILMLGLPEVHVPVEMRSLCKTNLGIRIGSYVFLIPPLWMFLALRRVRAIHEANLDRVESEHDINPLLPKGAYKRPNHFPLRSRSAR